METAETKAKLANAIRDLQAKGDNTSIQRLVGAYKTKYRSAPANNLQTDTSYVPVVSELSNFGIGVGTSIGKAGLGLGQMATKGLSAFNRATGNSGLADYNDKMTQGLEDIKQNVFTKPFEKQTSTGFGQAGTAVGNIAPYIESAGMVNPATANLPAVTRVIARTAPDILISGAQTGGDLKSMAGTGLVSGVSNALLPGSGELVQGFGGNAKQFVKGVIPGYVADVSGGLAGQRGEDRTGGKAFIPGAGTAISTLTSGVSTAANVYKNAHNPELQYSNISKENEKTLVKLEDSYPSVRKSTDKAMKSGIDAKKILSQTDLLHNSVDETGTLRTSAPGGAIEKLNDFIQPQEDVISNNLRREGRSIPLSEVRTKLLQNIETSGIKGAAKIRAINQVADEINGYLTEADTNGMIPLSILHDAKVDKYRNINYMVPESKTIDKSIARSLKQLVEENTKSVDVQDLNKQLQAHYSVLNLLEKLDGKKVDGGKVGKYFAKTVGAIVGSHFGPLGSIIGAETAGKIKGVTLRGNFGKALGQDLQQSDAMKKAIVQGNMPRLGLPAPAEGASNVSNYQPIPMMGPSSMEAPAQSIGYSNNLGALNTNQSNTTIPSNMGMSNNVAQSMPAVKIPSGDSVAYTPKQIIDHHFATNINTLRSMPDVQLSNPQKIEMLKETLNDTIKGLNSYGHPDIAAKLAAIDTSKGMSFQKLWDKVLKVMNQK
ncbi:MAG: hypothetical protein EBR82_14360 [Caulobacteraceae bacterium]|nr:hypothetical protein [Caulobacteraceae bacterium]